MIQRGWVISEFAASLDAHDRPFEESARRLTLTWLAQDALLAMLAPGWRVLLYSGRPAMRLVVAPLYPIAEGGVAPEPFQPLQGELERLFGREVRIVVECPSHTNS
jgi:hypothetical protein